MYNKIVVSLAMKVAQGESVQKDFIEAASRQSQFVDYAWELARYLVEEISLAENLGAYTELHSFGRLKADCDRQSNLIRLGREYLEYFGKYGNGYTDYASLECMWAMYSSLISWQDPNSTPFLLKGGWAIVGLVLHELAHALVNKEYPNRDHIKPHGKEFQVCLGNLMATYNPDYVQRLLEQRDWLSEEVRGGVKWMFREWEGHHYNLRRAIEESKK